MSRVLPLLVIAAFIIGCNVDNTDYESELDVRVYNLTGLYISIDYVFDSETYTIDILPGEECAIVADLYSTIEAYYYDEFDHQWYWYDDWYIENKDSEVWIIR